jgi:hypothetical protein
MWKMLGSFFYFRNRDKISVNCFSFIQRVKLCIPFDPIGGDDLSCLFSLKRNLTILHHLSGGIFLSIFAVNFLFIFINRFSYETYYFISQVPIVLAMLWIFCMICNLIHSISLSHAAPNSIVHK